MRLSLHKRYRMVNSLFGVLFNSCCRTRSVLSGSVTRCGRTLQSLHLEQNSVGPIRQPVTVRINLTPSAMKYFRTAVVVLSSAGMAWDVMDSTCACQGINGLVLLTRSSSILWVICRLVAGPSLMQNLAVPIQNFTGFGRSGAISKPLICNHTS
jgi:hypothetical protein